METTLVSETYCNGVLEGLSVALVERNASYYLRTDAQGTVQNARCRDEADGRKQYDTVIKWCRSQYA